MSYVVFYSYQYTNGAQFYEAIYMELAKHHQTILAYEMNGEPLGGEHRDKVDIVKIICTMA